MKKFSELGITADNGLFIGDKIKISKIINLEIKVIDFKIEESKYPKDKAGKCLCLQIEIDNEKRIVFTGSSVLIKMIEQVKKEDLPFMCQIVKEGEHFEFK